MIVRIQHIIHVTKYVLIDCLCSWLSLLVNSRVFVVKFGGVKGDVQIFDCRGLALLTPLLFKGQLYAVYERRGLIRVPPEAKKHLAQAGG